MLCPKCKVRHTMLFQQRYGKPAVRVDAPLYQCSYKGEPEYISPRCLKCYEKAEKRPLKSYATTN